MTSSSVFDGLAPAAVWAHFAMLCSIPRPSKGEARLREHLVRWAGARGLVSRVDAAGNLIVRKPASAGCEGAPGIVLQSHLDMVCQKNEGTAHDFSCDPIVPVLRDGWLTAEETTLGADNGVGVALMLAALEDTSLVHGPVEALFTVDEECGMGGARGLEKNALEGRLLLNLDTEAWGAFYIGCAGGLDVDVSRSGAVESLPPGYAGVRVDVHGLRGGHSGIDINAGRGHAIKLLVRVLREIARHGPLRVATLGGGTARNALPREAHATLAIPAEAMADLAAMFPELQATFRRELAFVDENVCVSFSPCGVARVMAQADQAAWLASLHAAPQGVQRMSVTVPGVVETSVNLGVVDLDENGGTASFMVRSLIDSAGIELARQIQSLFELSGARAEQSGHYPAWTPRPDSRLLALCRMIFREQFGCEATTEVIHAGLECGLISGKHVGMDCVSFGPTIRGAHAPGEAVEVSSVAQCWRLLKAVLAGCARSSAFSAIP